MGTGYRIIFKRRSIETAKIDLIIRISRFNPIPHGVFYVRSLHGGGVKLPPLPKIRKNWAIGMKLCMIVGGPK